MKINSASVQCPSCTDSQLDCIGTIPDAYIFAGDILDKPLPGGKLWRCKTCHLLFRWPRLSKKELDALYRKGEKWWHYVPKQRPDGQMLIRFLDENSVSGAILDVGCFAGGFLLSLNDCWEKSGIEPNIPAVEKAKASGIQILGSDWQDLAWIEQRFDVITAMDVIEHLENPFQFLRYLADRVKSGGYLLITTGNTDALSWRLMRSRYWYCTVAEHIVFINPPWCAFVAEKLNLKIRQMAFFSHTIEPRFSRRVYRTADNMFYRVAPRIYSVLRQWRNKSDVAKYAAKFKALRHYPPDWMIAKDHLFVAFQKE